MWGTPQGAGATSSALLGNCAILSLLTPRPVITYACIYLATSVEVGHDPRMTEKTSGDAGAADPSQSILHIHLLGDFQLTYTGQAVTGANTARLQALLTYLVLHRHAPRTRQQLAFLFWPDTNEAQALTNLRNLLHKLRHALPEPDRFLLVDTQTVQWRADAPCTIDVADFEAALMQATTCTELETAAKLYHGSLLPSCDDQWILPERQHLQRRIMDVLIRLIGALETEREYRTAIEYAQQLLQYDPFDETTYCTLMRLHAANGDRAGALRIYQRCVNLLQAEFAAAPAATTQELYQRLLATEAMPPAHTQKVVDRARVYDHLPLIGRTGEWKIMMDAWYRASSGKPHCLFLTGEAGIGKTRLAEELLVWAAHQGFPAATAHCYAAEGSLTYTPVIAWLRSPAIHQMLGGFDALWRSELARLLPELLIEQPNLPQPTPITQGWQRQRFFEALARAVLLQNKPLLMFIDDLQWADRDTIEWLHYLLRFDPNARLLLLATVRSEEVSAAHPLQALLTSLRRENLLTEVALGPLNAGETAALAMHVAATALSLAQATHLHQTTEGNPLFVVETMQTEARRIERGEQSALLLHALPPKVQAVIQARLALLSPPARELAGIAAAIGRAFSYPVLAEAADLIEATLVNSLDELCRCRIVREYGSDGYDFTHDRLREGAYNSLSAARRRLLHRRIAQVLVALHQPMLDAVSGQVATHYELAGMTAEAVPHYQRAAEVAQQVSANAEAIRYYRHALALLEGLAEEWPGLAPVLYERLAEILLLTSQVDEGRIAYQRAMSSIPAADSITQARLHRKIGNTWREQYQYPEAQRSYAEAERVLGVAPAIDATGKAEGERTPEWWQEWIQVLLEVDLVHYWLGPVQASDELRATLKPAIERYGTLHQQANFLQHGIMIEFRRRRNLATPAMVVAVKTALSLLETAEAYSVLPSVRFLLGFMTLWSGDPQGALEPLQTALAIAEQTGDLSLQARCLTYLAIAQRQCRRVAEAEQMATRSLATATVAHMPEYIGTAQANLAWVAWQLGTFEQARQYGQAALEAWRQLPAGHGSAQAQWTALCPLIALALDAGDTASAIDYIRLLLDPAQQRLPNTLTALFEQALLAWENGTPERVTLLLQQATALAQELRYL
jgi:DNA-binding SARP family transcriptional activator